MLTAELILLAICILTSIPATIKAVGGLRERGLL